MVAVNNLYGSRLRLIQQQSVLQSGNVNASNISLFENTEGLTQGMIDGTCTDGKDDGKIGLWEGIKSFAKGAVKSVTDMFSSPKNILKTVGTAVAGAALIAVTGGAATPFLIAGGVAAGAVKAGKGIYDASQATTDAEKRAALENVGAGTLQVATSALAAKSYTNATGNALFGKGSLSTYKNAGAQSFANAKTNFGNLTNSVKTNGSRFVQSVKNDMNIEVTKNTEINPYAIEQKNSFITEDGIEILDSSNSAVYSEVDRFATAKMRGQNIAADAKQLINGLKSDANMNAAQMVEELGKMGIGKAEAMKLIAANVHSQVSLENNSFSSNEFYM